jgi:hypothetical protein
MVIDHEAELIRLRERQYHLRFMLMALELIYPEWRGVKTLLN